MPIRFPTEAANADRMTPDPQPATPPPAPRPEGKPEQDKATAGKPGKDINAAGFIKDKDCDPA
ncbi:MAG: hypothetical protein ACAH21_05510 [Ramlibacter sp.]|nr:hypothetical protein [Ramlibacter sp.]